MRKGKNKHKTWNVLYFSGAQSKVKNVRVTKCTKLMFFLSGMVLSAILLSIAGYIYYLFEEKDMEQHALFKEIDIRDLAIEEAKSEVNLVKQDYYTLQQEATAVKQSIEEFKAFEEQLSQMELEIPGEVEETTNVEGSGGLEYPFGDSTDVSKRLMEMRSEMPDLITAFEETVERLLLYEKELRTIPTIMPTDQGRITSIYGNRSDPFNRNTSFHSGIDIAAPLNTAIYATADGEVIYAGWDGGYGRSVVIRHSDTYETIYAHLNHIDVSVGEKLEKGDKVGGMGTTGRSTGVHLHYEIKRNGEYVNPYLYMTFHEKSE